MALLPSSGQCQIVQIDVITFEGYNVTINNLHYVNQFNLQISRVLGEVND